MLLENDCCRECRFETVGGLGADDCPETAQRGRPGGAPGCRELVEKSLHLSLGAEATDQPPFAGRKRQMREPTDDSSTLDRAGYGAKRRGTGRLDRPARAIGILTAIR